MKLPCQRKLSDKGDKRRGIAPAPLCDTIVGLRKQKVHTNRQQSAVWLT